ncbi:hypothetical protein ACV357_32495, partial [Pseudomonas aeruginosa]
QPPVVQGLVKNVVNSTTSSMMGSVRNQLNAAWISDVVSVYRQSLAGRYPIAAGTEEVAEVFQGGVARTAGG